MNKIEDIIKAYECKKNIKNRCNECPYITKCDDKYHCECEARDDDALHYLKEYQKLRTFTDSISLAIAMVENIPSAEPEQKKGEWMLYESRSDIYDLEGVCTWGRAYRCSECGFIHWVIEDFGIYSFCPNCGADMRGE